MIITDTAQIDLLAEKLLNDNSEYRSIDPTDREYDFLKRHSASLKAVRMDSDDFSQTLITAFRDELMQAAPERMHTILLHIGTKELPTMEQINHLLETLHNGLEHVNLIWETASNSEEEGVTLFAVIGYRFTNKKQ